MQAFKVRACLFCLELVLPISSAVCKELACVLDLGLSSIFLLVASLGTQPHSGRSFPFRQVTLIDVLMAGGMVNLQREKNWNKMHVDYTADGL